MPGRFLIRELNPPQHSLKGRKDNPNPPTLLAYFKSRWGEVDGYLPILHKFKETHPNWRIIGILKSERMVNTASSQPFLYNKLEDTVDVLIHLSPKTAMLPHHIWYQKWVRKIASWYHRKCIHLSWRHVFRYLKHEKIELILKDHGHDDLVLLKLQSMFPAKCVSTPHGTGIFVIPPGSSYLKEQNTKVDLFLAGDQSEVPCFQKLLGSSQASHIQVVGRPRYDPWWIEHLVQLSHFKTSKEFALAQKSERTFLFVTREPSSSFFPKSVFQYLVRTVAETTLSNPNDLLIIKPHPLQDLGLLKEILKDFDSSRWIISSLQSMQLAYISDFSICMLSSVILDSLAVGKPTVEYFQYTCGLDRFLKDEKGKTTSIYKRLGLVVSAEKKEELENLIKDYFHSKKPCWKQQVDQFKEFLKTDNNSTSRAITAMEQLLPS
jgi:hypothetical protein